MNHLGTKALETERLLLRRFSTRDAENMYNNWASDEEVTKYLTWPAHESIETTRASVNHWISQYPKEDFYHWAIVPKDLQEPIGTIGAVAQDNSIDRVHIGYCIGRNWWGQGYMSEAFRCLITFFFEETKVNRIEAGYDPRNPGSGKVMQKCGLHYEGTLRQAAKNNQGICDAARYAILAEDYLKEK